MMKAEGEAAKKLSNPNSAVPKDFEAQRAGLGLSPGGLNGFGAGRFAGMDSRGANGDKGSATTSSSPSSTSAGYGNIVGNFGVDSRGVLNGFTHQMYSSQFRPLGYNEPVAKNVAGILGRNEGLSGVALVARTKEVAHDTKEGLGLAVNKYAPAVANVGKQNSDKTIEHKHLLDEAEKLQNEGKTEEAAKVLEQYNQRRDQHMQQMQQAPQKNPNVIPDQRHLYQGIEQNHRGIQNNPAFRPISSKDEKYGAGGPKVVGKAPASDTEQRADLEDLGFLGEKSGPTKAADATPVKGLEKGEATKPENASTKVSSLESKPASLPKSSEKAGTTKPDGTDTKVATHEPNSGPSAKGKAPAASPKMA
jgi:hypothetical protein